MDEDKIVTFEMFKLYDKLLKELIGIPDDEDIVDEENKDEQGLGE